MLGTVRHLSEPSTFNTWIAVREPEHTSLNVPDSSPVALGELLYLNPEGGRMFWRSPTGHLLGHFPLYRNATGSDFYSDDESSSGSATETPRAVLTNRTPAELLASIRSNLSLRVNELAEVLHVQRPTVYAWMQSESLPREQNNERLLEVASIAAEWTKLANNPLGAAVRQRSLSSPSLLELLKKGRLNRTQISGALLQLQKESCGPQKKSEKRLSAAERAKRLGFDLSKVRENDAELQLVTGKRIDEE